MKKLGFGFAAALLCVVFVATEADAANASAARDRSARSATSPARRRRPRRPSLRSKQRPLRHLQRRNRSRRAVSRKWAPLLGGLALGGALGWLMGANGMGGLMVGLLLVGLLVFAGIFVVRMLAQKRGEAPQRFQYAGMGSETVAAPPPSQAAGFDAQPAPRGGVEHSRRLRCRRLPARRQAELHEAADRQRPGQPR